MAAYIVISATNLSLWSKRCEKDGTKLPPFRQTNDMIFFLSAKFGKKLKVSPPKVLLPAHKNPYAIYPRTFSQPIVRNISRSPKAYGSTQE
jgi:hypothetical protein